MKALYARQSLDKKDSLSVESQIEQCKLLLKSNDNFKVYEDKGFSGKNTARPSLTELLQDIKNKKVDTVIVYRLDRFSRNIVDFFNLYEVMKKHECEFISVSENFDTTSPMGRAMMSILITFAQMERENIQQRVKDNYYYRISQDGRWAGGPAPYAFINSRTQDGKPSLAVDAKQMEAVKLAFELYTNEINISLGKVAKTLTERGYKSNRANGSWDSSTISKILQNTVYVKADEKLYKYLEIRQIKFLNNKEMWNGSSACHIVGKRVGNANIRKYTDFKEQSVYLTNFSGIIDSRTYINVMDRLALNEQLTSSNKPSALQELGGKLKCSCGYAIKVYSKSTNGRPYLDCYANRTLHICHRKFSNFMFADIQNYVGDEIQKQLDNLTQILKSKRKVRIEKQNKIRALEKQLDNLINLASTSDLLEQATIKKIETTQRQINEMQLELQLSNDILDDLQIPHFSPSGRSIPPIIYTQMSLEEKKYLVNIFIEKIVLTEETEQLEIFWNI